MRGPSLLLLVLVSILLASTSRAQQEVRGPSGLFGPVQTVREERVTFTKENGKAVEGPRVLVQTMTFNEDGSKWEQSVYGPSGEVIFLYRLQTFGPDGRNIERQIFNGKGMSQGRTVTFYDEQKRPSEIISYRDDGSIGNKITYRRSGNTLESENVTYDRQGAIIAQEKMTNDLPQGQFESVLTTPRSTAESRGSLTRNPDGSQELREQRSTGEAIHEKTISDGRGSMDRVIYNPDGTINRTERLIREFDQHHNLIKTTHQTATGDSKDFDTVDINYRIFTYYEKK